MIVTDYFEEELERWKSLYPDADMQLGIYNDEGYDPVDFRDATVCFEDDDGYLRPMSGYAEWQREHEEYIAKQDKIKAVQESIKKIIYDNQDIDIRATVDRKTVY